MASNSKLSRENRMIEKANALFMIYYQMGAERSLMKLLEVASMAGVRTSESRLAFILPSMSGKGSC